MIARIVKQWFLLALAGVLVGGAWFHAALAPAAEAVPRDLLVAGIMLLMSAPLDLRRSLAGPRARVAVAVGVAVNAGLAGPLAYLMGGLLSEQLAIGLIVAALAPCTLASAAVWTRRGGGNEAVALTITVATSLLCFLTLPGWAWLLIGQTRSFDAGGLALRLLLIVVLPIAVGQAIRAQPVCRAWCDLYRKRLSLAAQFGLLGMVFVGAVRSGGLLADPETRVGAGEWAVLAATAAAVHLTLFAIAWRASRLLGAPRGEALASAVGGSQKTLAVGLSVAMDFGSLAILPMIVYHALQLLLDAGLVDWLRTPEQKNRGPDGQE